MTPTCTLCGTSLYFLPLDTQSEIWANQEWNPPVCGSECGTYFLPFTQFDWWTERSDHRDKVQAWIKSAQE